MTPREWHLDRHAYVLFCEGLRRLKPGGRDGIQTCAVYPTRLVVEGAGDSLRSSRRPPRLWA